MLGLVGAALTLFAGKGRLPGIGNDATSYWAIADRLEAGRGLGYFLEPRLTLWPPGWPAYLTAMKWLTGLSVPVIGLWTNALLVVVTGVLAWRLVTRFTSVPLLVWATVVSATIGPATLSQSYFLQTETGFNVLVLAAMLALLRFAERRRPSDLGLAVVVMWAAFMYRYVGIVAIGAGTVWLVFDRGARSGVERLRNAAVFFLCSCAVPAAWLVRNVATNDWRWGTAFGPRDTPLATYKTNAADALTSLGQFITGVWRYAPWKGLLRLVVLGVLAVAGWIALTALRRWRARRVAGSSGLTRGPLGVREVIGHPVGLLCVYVVAHWAYMIYSASTIAFDPVNTRYLAPIFIPALIAAMTLVDRSGLGGLAPGRPPDDFGKLLRSGVGIWMVVQVLCGLGMASAPWWNRYAAGYHGSAVIELRDSELLDRVPVDCDLYASIPMALYPAGFEPRIWPRRTKFASSDVPTDLEDLRRTLDGRDACLLWIAGFEDQVDYEYTPAELGALFPAMTEIDRDRVDDDDLILYRIPTRR